MRRIAVVAVIAWFSSSAGARAETDVPPAVRPQGSQRAIRVTGEGHVQVSPDLATVTIAVTAIDASLAKAAQDANDAARRVRDAVLSSGVAPPDVQTTSYDVRVERRADTAGAEPRIAGYRVTNAIRLKVRDPAKLGAILDRAVAAGANEIEALAFVKEDTTADEARALAIAVRAARVKAEEIARAAGVRIGDPVEIVEGAHGRSPGPLPVRAMAMVRSEAPVQPGTIDVASTVEVVFAIQ